jgi:CheY-like chemotaxis protein
LLIQQSAEHKGTLEELVVSTGRDSWAAKGAASQALGSSAGAGALFRDAAGRAASSAVTASQLYSGARRQHQALCELMVQLDAIRGAELTMNGVLVVDDHGDIREFIASLLRDAGFAVCTAANGLEALMIASEMRPGVILMDLAMPVLGGVEATRLIKASELTRDARVIAYTGETNLDAMTMQRLFAAVLHKPATPDAVLATVQQVAWR